LKAGMDKMQITNIVAPGDRIDGLLLRPDKVQTFGVIDPIAGEAVAVMLTPYDGDVGFSKPLTVVIPAEKIDLFIELLRTAQERLLKAQGGAA